MNRLHIISALFICSLVLFNSCKDDPTPTTPAFDASPLLKNCAENVITATYENLSQAADQLVVAVENLESTPDATRLESAREAWRITRKPWEESEGFLFGPVATKGIDPAIDSWPVNIIDLEAVLNGGDVLSKTFIDGLEGTLKGFHTIEYLLWGENGNKLATDFTDREFEYLISLCESLAGETKDLWISWDESGENFQINISEAGSAASIYSGESAAIQELINGMIGIADEVANGKINDPFSTGDVTLEESRFSANSKTDFADNIRSIQNIYLGAYDGVSGSGVKAFVANFDADLADHVEVHIQEAINAIEAIPGTFTEAIISNPAEVEAAQQSIIDLKLLLESEVLPLIEKL